MPLEMKLKLIFEIKFEFKIKILKVKTHKIYRQAKC